MPLLFHSRTRAIALRAAVLCAPLVFSVAARATKSTPEFGRTFVAQATPDTSEGTTPVTPDATSEGAINDATTTGTTTSNDATTNDIAASGTASNGTVPNNAAANAANSTATNAANAGGTTINQTGAKPNAAKADVLPARGTLRIDGAGELFSVFAVAADAQELFTALADKAGLRLVIDDTVSRKITVNIPRRAPRQIIEDIVGAYGLSVADVGGVVMISEGIPRSPSSYLLSDIASIQTKYVDAANARNLLPVFLQDYVKVNSEQNAVVLSAPADVLAKFRQDIAQFDIPASQILVELLVVELTDNSADQLGLSLNYINGDHGVSFDAGVGATTYRATTNLPSQFFVALQALQRKGKARVRANPRIATISGRRASIFVGLQRYIATPIDSGRNFFDAGVRLNITPYTGGEKRVLVDVDTEVSTLSAPDPVTNLPEKSTRTANTTVRVSDGETIIIGGLKQQESRDVRTKVPILGDLPILGKMLFRSRSIRTNNTELMLFITPRILSETGHLPADEEARLKKQYLNGDLNQPLPPLSPVPPAAAPFVAPQNNGAKR